MGQHVQLKGERSKVVAFRAIARDIPKQKQVEEAFKKYQEELEAIFEAQTLELKKKNELLELEISERRQAEASLKISEEKYRTILDTIEDGYYEVDLRGNLTFFNDALARLHEYPRDELMGMNNRLYTDPENAKKLYQAFNQVYLTGTPSKPIDYEIITKNGGKKCFESSISLMGDSSGKPVGFRGIVRDITELKKSEEALKESEKEYRTILDTIEDGYYEVNRGGYMTFLNGALARIHEYPKNEMLGLHSRDYTDVENSEILKREFTRVYETQQPSKGIHYEIITKNGGRKSLETSISIRQDSSGNFIGFSGIARDITELREAQNGLQTSEERFRIAAQSSYDFIYEWDLNTEQIDWFGDATERLKYLLGEIPVTATAFGKIIYPDDYGRFLESIRRHLRHGGHYKEEYRIVGKDGRIIHVKAAGMGLRNRDGKVYKWIGALSDITDQKRTEEELKESLEKLHKAMGGIIKAMILTVEKRDPYTAGHQLRVSNLARTIAQEMGLSKDQIEATRIAGLLHDLGKISVPTEILSKPSRLSEIEFSLIKTHPQTSYEILKDLEFPWPIAQIVLQHHERIDGSGYPFGLKDQEILLEAKVLMVGDVVEAISSHRPYRPSRGIDAALEEISQNKGILYDPSVVDACLRQFTEKGYVIE